MTTFSYLCFSFDAFLPYFNPPPLSEREEKRSAGGKVRRLEQKQQHTQT
jgi:hypothetical protein